MIRIYVFINGNQGAQTNSNAQDVWFAIQHPEVEDIHIIDAANPDNQAFIQQFQVSSFPTIVFVELTSQSQGRTITRIVGPASKEQIQETLNQIINDPNTGEQGEEGQNVILGEGNQTSFGLGLLNLSLPNLFFLLAGAYIIYQEIRS